MSASGDGLPVRLSTYVEDNSRVKKPSKDETSEISPVAFSKKCTVSVPEEKDEKTESDKSELRNSVPPTDCLESCSFVISDDQTEPMNLEESYSPSSSLNDHFKRMHFDVPKINYAEKIIFCLDMSSDMEQVPFKLGDGTQHSPLNMVKRTIELFVENKHFVNRKHEFSLMVLYENATWIIMEKEEKQKQALCLSVNQDLDNWGSTVFMVREFTNDPKELIDSLQDLNETQACETCDLASVVTLITEKYELRIPRRISLLPCIFRIILIYGRSSCMFHFASEEARDFLINYPFFVLDIIYIHEPPSNDNKCQEIFEALCDLDVHNKSYIFEVTRNTTKLHNSMAKLLTHPIQRCPQKDTAYTIRTPFSQDIE